MIACRLQEARQVVDKALGMEALRSQRAPFRQQFLQLRDRLDKAVAGKDDQT
jgi:histidine ammonia-lyase